jgi:hypothetical protein
VTRVDSLRGFFSQARKEKNLQRLSGKVGVSEENMVEFLNKFEETMREATGDLSRATSAMAMAARHVFNLACYRLIAEYASTLLRSPDQSFSNNFTVPRLGRNGLQAIFQPILSGLRGENTLDEKDRKIHEYFQEVARADQLDVLLDRLQSDPTMDNTLNLFQHLTTSWFMLSIKYCSTEPVERDERKRFRKHTPAVVQKLITDMLTPLQGPLGDWFSAFTAAAQQAQQVAQCLVAPSKFKYAPRPVGSLCPRFSEAIQKLLKFAGSLSEGGNPSVDTLLSEFRLPLTDTSSKFHQISSEVLSETTKLYVECGWESFPDKMKEFDLLCWYFPQLARQLAVECLNRVKQGIRELCSRFWKHKFPDKKVQARLLDELVQHVPPQDGKEPPKNEDVRAVFDSLLNEIPALPRAAGSKIDEGCYLDVYLRLYTYMRRLDEKLPTSFRLLPLTNLSHSPIVMFKGDVLYHKIVVPLHVKLANTNIRSVAERLIPPAMLPDKQGELRNLTQSEKYERTLAQFVNFFSDTEPMCNYLKSFDVTALRSDGFQLQFLLERNGKDDVKRNVKKPEKKSDVDEYQPVRRVAVDPGVRSIVTVCECTTVVCPGRIC